MQGRRLLALSGLLLLSGCLYHAREHADETLCALAARPYDLLPTQPAESKTGAPTKKAETSPAPAMDVQTSA
jgi:hypothetical protein